jgi:CDP-diacylglycerol--serine O-phosphatidyltransferase
MSDAPDVTPPDALPPDVLSDIAKRRHRRAVRLRRSREQRRLRLRRHGRRAYIRSVYFLPSLATLGNAICGFAAIYICERSFSVAAYLIFLAMVFDALDGRLARFARHTTDFGGQLDSLADVLSFGAAPAFIALKLFKVEVPSNGNIIVISRLVWAISALYMSCAAIRLARFNVSNEHGEQHHFSFLGLPSPGAAAAVASVILMQQELKNSGWHYLEKIAPLVVYTLPILVLCTGLLMVSNLRYPHIVNRYLRGKRSIGRLITVLVLALLLIAAHQYTLAVGAVAYAAWGPVAYAGARVRRRQMGVGVRGTGG